MPEQSFTEDDVTQAVGIALHDAAQRSDFPALVMRSTGRREELTAAVRALFASGTVVPARTHEWEWGVRDEHWPGGPFVHGGYTEAEARAQVVADDVFVVRRRPASPWEDVAGEGS